MSISPYTPSARQMDSTTGEDRSPSWNPVQSTAYAHIAEAVFRYDYGTNYSLAGYGRPVVIGCDQVGGGFVRVCVVVTVRVKTHRGLGTRARGANTRRQSPDKVRA